MCLLRQRRRLLLRRWWWWLLLWLGLAFSRFSAMHIHHSFSLSLSPCRRIHTLRDAYVWCDVWYRIWLPFVYYTIVVGFLRFLFIFVWVVVFTYSLDSNDGQLDDLCNERNWCDEDEMYWSARYLPGRLWLYCGYCRRSNGRIFLAKTYFMLDCLREKLCSLSKWEPETLLLRCGCYMLNVNKRKLNRQQQPHTVAHSGIRYLQNELLYKFTIFFCFFLRVNEIYFSLLGDVYWAKGHFKFISVLRLLLRLIQFGDEFRESSTCIMRFKWSFMTNELVRIHVRITHTRIHAHTAFNCRRFFILSVWVENLRHSAWLDKERIVWQK